MKKAILVVMMVFIITGISQASLKIDWVTVGNAGNATDSTGYGAVGYEYQISKYEVTAGQYTEFLNAVAATDTYDLYNTEMWSNDSGCKIQRSGSSGSYTYSVASDWANRPVNHVSWYDSLRFTNWLHNGLGTGDTEDGAYDMSLGSSVVRKASATVWLPSENEWYKAAYHKNDGVTGSYFLYPTSSDSTPSNVLINPDPGNNATFWADGSSSIDSPYYRTEVGAYENSDSPYGTFDMGGNVYEWNEALVMRGGSFGSYEVWNLDSSGRFPKSPSTDRSDLGFRVASVPEPATLLLLGLGGLMIRRKR